MPNLTGGIILARSLVSKTPLSTCIKTDPTTNVKYLECKLYQVKSLANLIPGHRIRTELISLAGVILGNDYLHKEE